MPNQSSLFRRPLFTAFFTCLLFSLSASAAPAAPTTAPAEKSSPASEAWSTLLLNGKPAGYLHESTSRDGDRITTHRKMVMHIKRGDANVVAIILDSSFIETATGEPIECSSSMSLGASGQTVTNMKFAAKDVQVTTTANGKKTTETKPRPAGDWLTPAAADRFITEQVAKGAKKFSVRTVDPESGLDPSETTYNLKGAKNIEVVGKTVPALEWEQTLSSMPNTVVQTFTDLQGRPLRAEVALGGIMLTILRSDRQLAENEIDPPDLMAASLIVLDRPIKDARNLRSAVFELKLPPQNKTAPSAATLPSTGCQRVVWADQSTARVVLDLDNPVAPGDDLPTDANRKPSSMITSDDKTVQEFAQQAVKDLPKDATPAQKAEAARRFVYSFIQKKDLSVGLASAAEVARTAQGDCTEHAVLLAALLRALDIPSRTVTGLIYADLYRGKKNILGYHMWTQAWLDPGDKQKPQGARWTDLDAVLDDDHPFDAAHITLLTETMADGSVNNDMVRLAPLFGVLKIKLIDPAAVTAPATQPRSRTGFTPNPP